MFRRTSLQDGDIVAAAQRRLAALAQHHAEASDPRAAWTIPPPDAEPNARGDDDTATVTSAGGTTSAPPSASETPRHLGVPRRQLARWDVNAHHLTVAVLGVVVLVVAVAWWSLRSVPQSDTVELSSHGVSTPVIATSPPAVPEFSQPPAVAPTAVMGPPVTTASSRLVVDVAGKVRRPGIVELPAGSRVVDAIAAAGGADKGVSLTSLNLARLLVDGEQIVVGIDVPSVGGAQLPGAPPATSATASIAPVNLNTATGEELDTLPGVGPVTAQAILDFRTDNGAFTSVDELLEVSGIGDATLADLRPYVYV